jgi:hypothetical protein
MSAPSYGQQELWDRFVTKFKEGDRVDSLTGGSCHRIGCIDKVKQEYEVEYESGCGAPRPITAEGLYAVVCEVYRIGRVTNKYMEDNCQRLLGWRSWHSPGSALFAILPQLDERIAPGGVKGGELHLRPERVKTG